MAQKKHIKIFSTGRFAQREREREREIVPSKRRGDLSIYGFPMRKGSWCQSKLKQDVLTDNNIKNRLGIQNDVCIFHYIGIASDEPKRIERHICKENVALPLVQIGWDEALCGLEAQYLDMLSPTYNSSTRDGCWFCHNQGVKQLRKLYENNHDLWELLLNLDKDSPIIFTADMHSVCDYDKRFTMEENGQIDKNRRFLWSMVK